MSGVRAVWQLDYERDRTVRGTGQCEGKVSGRGTGQSGSWTMAGIIFRGCCALPLIFSLERSKVTGIRYCTYCHGLEINDRTGQCLKWAMGGGGDA